MRAVVVDLPLVPVIPMKAASRWERTSNSVSPMTSRPAARAMLTTGCSSGRPWGMPGLRTRVVSSRQLQR